MQSKSSWENDSRYFVKKDVDYISKRAHTIDNIVEALTTKNAFIN